MLLSRDANKMPVSRGRKSNKLHQQQISPNKPLRVQPTDGQQSLLKRISDHPIMICVGMLATFLGIAAAIVTLLPSVSVEPFGPFDPSASSPTLFNIVNSGPNPILRIRPTLGLCDLQYERGIEMLGECPGIEPGTKFAPIFWRREYLAHGDNYTISLQDVFRTHQPKCH